MVWSSGRQAVVNAAFGALHANSHFNYHEWRPIPYQNFVALMNGHDITVNTDCSGLVTCCFYRAGQPDPNGRAYDGQGFTGTLLDHLPHISLGEARPGDLAVFGDAPGRHVVIIVGTGSDPQCISHGKQGDPHEAPLSNFLGLGRLTVLRGEFVVKRHRRVRKVKAIVRGDNNHIIGHVYSTRWLWQLRHHPTVRKFAVHHLHFDPPTD